MVNNETTEEMPTMKEPDDKVYYKQFLEGDNSAFDALVIRHKDSLIYFINRLVKNITIAEDLAQDAFVELLVHRERYHFKTGFKTYLFTIGHNKAVDYIRKNQRIELVSEYPELPREELSPEYLVVEKEMKKILSEGINSLKPEYQLAIQLIDLEGLSYREAAKVLEKSETQVRVLIHRARKSLEKLLRKEGTADEK